MATETAESLWFVFLAISFFIAFIIMIWKDGEIGNLVVESHVGYMDNHGSVVGCVQYFRNVDGRRRLADEVKT